jgi:hypothetical protein
MFEVAFRHGAPDAPRTTLWFSVPAIAVLVLPLFARRRFPFAAPAAFWLLGVGLSFIDGQLVTFTTSVFVLGMAASFLLGNQRAAVVAQTGLAVVAGGDALLSPALPRQYAEVTWFPPAADSPKPKARGGSRERRSRRRGHRGRPGFMGGWARAE